MSLRRHVARHERPGPQAHHQVGTGRARDRVLREPQGIRAPDRHRDATLHALVLRCQGDAHLR